MLALQSIWAQEQHFELWSHELSPQTRLRSAAMVYLKGKHNIPFTNLLFCSFIVIYWQLPFIESWYKKYIW